MPHLGETLGHSLSCLSPLSFLFSVFAKDRTLLIRIFTPALGLCGMNELLPLSTPLWPALSGRCSACVFPSWVLAKHRHYAFLCGFWRTFFSSLPRLCASSQVTHPRKRSWTLGSDPWFQRPPWGAHFTSSCCVLLSVSSWIVRSTGDVWSCSPSYFRHVV